MILKVRCSSYTITARTFIVTTPWAIEHKWSLRGTVKRSKGCFGTDSTKCQSYVGGDVSFAKSYEVNNPNEDVLHQHLFSQNPILPSIAGYIPCRSAKERNVCSSKSSYFVSLQMSVWPYLFSLPMTFVCQKLSHIFLSSPQFCHPTREAWRNHHPTLVEVKMLGIFKGTMTTSQIKLELTFVIAGTTI